MDLLWGEGRLQEMGHLEDLLVVVHDLVVTRLVEQDLSVEDLWDELPRDSSWTASQRDSSSMLHHSERDSWEDHLVEVLLADHEGHL